ncbi:response regulator transcription factor [Brooklawnia cerclae]|uniref:DNA-binding response OmpR family regulator n=1 Tax=Brooklawnia cerclae TaxID=349934 RepID=A0ABX0SIH6_9ACTN|nr:response regulator transcription factor [Brooklawnia cerclae]NIH56556.1 DNA-binding response OmpR family regulator [Brooklawnia cerclae]
MGVVLVVEDNADVNAMLARHLRAEGYDVRQAFDGPGALEGFAAGDVDAVLLDITLPNASGAGLLTAWRRSSQTPVIVVSARDAVWTKVDLLKLGADDYITKPFDLDELTARLEAVMRRARPAQPRVLSYGRLSVDLESMRVTVDDQDIDLTVTEMRILEALMSVPGRVRTKASIHTEVWDEPYPGDDSAIKTHVSHLRGKLKAADPGTTYIETVWGLGYRMPRSPRTT